MKYIVFSMSILIVLTGCQMDEPLQNNNDVASAPGIIDAINPEDLIDCSEPAYLISVSPEPGSTLVFDSDTNEIELLLVFSCAPADLVFYDDYHDFKVKDMTFQGHIYDSPWGGLPIDGSVYLSMRISEINKNTAKIKLRDKGNREFYQRVGRPEKTAEMPFILQWTHGLIPLKYNVEFKEIVAQERPMHVNVEDILNNPHDFQNKEITFEATVSRVRSIRENEYGDRIYEFEIPTNNITIQFFVIDSRYWIRNRIADGVNFNDKKIRFSCLISSVSERDDGLTTINAELIYIGRSLIYPPVFIND